ncbi:hypothetical protein K1719_031924 [Acacia pycnantha]|nr:hypothetical protein K1719_031924 [Acacia pycnantha]
MREDEGLRRECLDRVVVNGTWRTKFEKGPCFVLEAIGSDHTPLLLKFEISDHIGLKPFRFDERWLLHPQLEEIVKTWGGKWKFCYKLVKELQSRVNEFADVPGNYLGLPILRGKSKVHLVVEKVKKKDSEVAEKVLIRGRERGSSTVMGAGNGSTTRVWDDRWLKDLPDAPDWCSLPILENIHFIRNLCESTVADGFQGKLLE